MKNDWKYTRFAAAALAAALLLTSGVLAAEQGAGDASGAAEIAASAAVGGEYTAPHAEEAEGISTETAAPESGKAAAQPYIQPAAQRTEDWRLLLVNPWNALPEDYEMKLATLSNGMKVDARIYGDLNAMLSACREDGLRPIVCSAYRTEATQVRLYNNKIARLRSAGWDSATLLQEAARWVAVPGTSEHQTGLALDIVSAGYQLLDEAQEDTAEQKWLMEHCWEYGFILRFPEEKTEITGIGYEPWHYRYVGRETAEAIHKSGLCLEEYLQSLPSAETESAADAQTAGKAAAPAEGGAAGETASSASRPLVNPAAWKD